VSSTASAANAVYRRRRDGLIFGYATLGERALNDGIEILAEAISDVRLP
jgi:hypothetical protein